MLQVLLRWEMQRGVSTAFKAVNPKHIASNLEALHWELPPEDMRALTTIAYAVSPKALIHLHLHLASRCIYKALHSELPLRKRRVFTAVAYSVGSWKHDPSASSLCLVTGIRGHEGKRL